MRRGALIALLIAVAGCGAPGKADRDAEVHPRQQPSVTEPGLHISGQAHVGVKGRF